MTASKAPTARRPMSLGDATAIATLGSLATILVSVTQSKVTAVLLGPEGVGELAELRQIATTILVPMGIFNGAPFVALLAEANGRGDCDGAQRVYDVLSTVAVASGLVLAAAVVVFGAASMPNATLALLLSGIGSAAAVWRGLPSQALLAFQEMRTSTLISVLGSFVSAAFVIAGTYAYGVVGQLAGFALAAAATWPLGMAMARRAHPGFRMLPRPRLEWSALRRAVTIGGATLICGFAAQASLSVVRWALHRSGGPEENGQYQAAWLVGSGYLTLVLGGLGSVAFPRYAAATSREALEAHVEEAGRFVMRVAPPFVLFAIAIRVPLVEILYSGRFGETADVLGIMMAGDVSKSVAYVQAGPLLYRGHVRALILSETITGVLQGVVALLLVPRLGAVGGGWASTISFIVYALVTVLIVERACGIRVNRSRTLASLVFAVAAVLCVRLTAGRPVLQAALAVAAAIQAYRAGLLHAAVAKLRSKLGRADGG